MHLFSKALLLRRLRLPSPLDAAACRGRRPIDPPNPAETRAESRGAALCIARSAKERTYPELLRSHRTGAGLLCSPSIRPCRSR